VKDPVEKNEALPKTEIKKGKNRFKWTLIVLVFLLGLAFVLGYWWFYKRNRVTTDDAYARADSAQISSRIIGTVEKVFVKDDQWVKAGDVLILLDQRDYRLMVNKARAALDEIKAKIKAREISMSLTDSQTLAQVKEAEAAFQAARDREREMSFKSDELRKNRAAAMAVFTHAQKNFRRFEKLSKRGAISESELDTSRMAFKKARADLSAIDAAISAIKASICSAKQQAGRAKAELSAARGDRARVEIQKYNVTAMKATEDRLKTELKVAQLDLSYCRITAPISGYITRKNVQVGNHIQPGMPFLAIVPLKDIYVQANFKETQLRDVRLGQPVKIHADIYPDFTYRGKVVGIGAGTGAAFSLLPPENATGNWIKVVQRIPLRIQLTSPPSRDHPLRVGLSLEVTIFTNDRRGAFLASKIPPSS